MIAFAETGTGKTVAFMIQILDILLSLQLVKSRLMLIRVLILAPTREMIIQIRGII